MAKKQTIQPLGDRILVRALALEETTKAGIILPDTSSKERPQEGEVLAVGTGKKNDDGKVLPMTIKVGDRVLFSKYGPTEIKIDREELLILSESDVLAIIK